MSCDLCGKGGKTVPTKIEGAIYNACKSCAEHGQRLERAKPKQKRRPKPQNLVVRENVGDVLRLVREKKELTQEEFSQRISVKESELHAWETGHRRPTLKDAKRIQKKIGVRLTEQDSSPHAPVGNYSSSSSGRTIGDVFKK